jgi:micrococcal nuclease
MGLFRVLIRVIMARGPPPPARRSAPMRPPDRPIPREMRFPVAQPNRPQPQETIVSGWCRVIDGDTIVINGMHIRLAGIDAPELDHPWGHQSKWAMVKLCKGQTVTARIKPYMSYDRVVAECFLPDGRDLAAELVQAGLALDWPKFSGGKYRHLEPPDARKKLWRANLRQSGVMWPTDGMLPAAARNVSVSSARLQTAMPAPAVGNAPARANYRIGWLVGSGLVVLLVGCSFIGGDADRNVPVGPGNQAAALASFAVTAGVLNIRREPAVTSSVIAQIGRGTKVIPKRMSGAWYGIEMPDGSTGWVHRDFLTPVGQ